MATIHAFKPRGKMADDNPLNRLRDICEICVAECRVLLKYDTVEQRRKCWLEYGQTLLAIKKLIPNKNEFNAYIRQHQLDVRDASFRSKVIWMAENWNDLGHVLSRSDAANPERIYKAYREQNPSQRKIAASSTIGTGEADEADEAEKTDEADEVGEAETDKDKFGKAIAGLWTAIGEANLNVHNMQLILSKEPTIYDQFKQADIERIFHAWDILAKRMAKIRR